MGSLAPGTVRIIKLSVPFSMACDLSGGVQSGERHDEARSPVLIDDADAMHTSGPRGERIGSAGRVLAPRGAERAASATARFGS